MAGKAKGVPHDTAVTLRLPQELHEQLKSAAAGRSVSEEIRARLESSFKIIDQPTEELVGAIVYVTSSLSIDGGWHKDPYLFEVLKAAISRLLEHWRPTKPVKAPKYVMIPKGLSPEVAAQMLAAFALNKEPNR
jgi:hypothetical protein